MIDIKTDDYQIWYEAATHTVFLEGFLRLDGMAEYQPIMDGLLAAIGDASEFTINLEKLEFLNSSGISMLSMFVVKMRGRENLKFNMTGSQQVLWQTKSLRNLQRLMPNLNLELL